MSPGKAKTSDDVPNTASDDVGKEKASDDVPNTGTPSNVTASDDAGKEKASDDVPNTPTDVTIHPITASDDAGKEKASDDVPNTPTDVTIRPLTTSDDAGKEKASNDVPNTPTDVTIRPIIAITPDAVVTLFNGGNSDMSYNVQVFSVQEGYTQSGNKNYVVTLSDGVHLLDAFVSPQLFHLFDTKAVKKQVMVTVHRSLLTVVGGCKHVVLLHLVIGAYHEHLIGNPVYVTSTSQGMSTASCDVSNISPMMFISPCEVKNRFQDGISNLDKDTVAQISVACDNCNCIPCDWTRYSPEIISYVKEKYEGCYLDSAGNVVDENVDGAAIVTNHHLRYLCYSAFSAAKHGYLGKKKRIPLPACVTIGIRDVFPDDRNAYVGFKYAKTEK
jgi:hypothetical protein